MLRGLVFRMTPRLDDLAMSVQQFIQPRPILAEKFQLLQFIFQTGQQDVQGRAMPTGRPEMLRHLLGATDD
jgi:hypothetical protein